MFSFVANRENIDRNPRPKRSEFASALNFGGRCKFASAFMSEYRSFPTGLERLASQVKRLIAFY